MTLGKSWIVDALIFLGVYAGCAIVLKFISRSTDMPLLMEEPVQYVLAFAVATAFVFVRFGTVAGCSWVAFAALLSLVARQNGLL